MIPQLISRLAHAVSHSFSAGAFARILIALLFGAAVAAPSLATTTINHQFTNATINPGDVSKYRITLTNDDTGSTLTGVNVTVVLQPQITIAAPLNMTNTCGFTVSQPAAAGGSTVQLVNGTLAAGASGVPSQCYFEIDVTSSAAGNWINTIPANVIVGGPPGTPAITPDASTTGYLATTTATGQLVANTTPANATLSVNTLSAPTGSKSFSPNPAYAGNPVTLSIVLSNPNAAATMPLTSFTDTLPDDGNGHEMLVNGVPTVNCTGTGASNGSVSAAPDNKSVTLTGGIIGQSGACTISVPISVSSINGTSQSFNNTVSAGAIGNTRGLNSNGFNASLTVNTPIGITKSFGTSPIPVGQASLMTLRVNNNSSVNALDISSFTDNLTGTTLQVLTTASVPVAAAADPSVTCTGSGAANGTLSFTPDTVDTTISLSGAVAGPSGNCTIQTYVTSYIDGIHPNTTSKVTNPARNYDSTAASASLTAKGQLLVSKSVSVANVAPGQWTEFTVTIQNYAGVQINNVQFKDLLPKNGANQMVVYDPAGTTSGIYTTTAGCTGGAWTGLNGAGTGTGLAPVSDVDAGLQWSGGSIVAGVGATPGVCTIRIRAKLPAAAASGLTFTNQIPLDSVTGTRQDDGNPVSNPDTAPAVNVTSVDAVALSKSFSPGSIAQGGLSTLTLTVYNRFVNAINNVNITDTLPAGVTLAANPSAVNNCGGSLQAFPNDSQIVLTGGALNARPDASQQTTCTVTVRVTGSTLGTYTNSIPPANFSSSGGTISGNASANLTITTGITGSKNFTPTAVTPGGTARVSITVNNTSSGQLNNVAIVDPLPAGLTVANPANAASSCSGSPALIANPGASSASLLGARLNAGASCTFSFDVLTSGAGPWTNTIPSGNVTSAEGPQNTAAISATLSPNTASIGINKSFNPVVVTGGVPSVLTIDVINSSSITIHGVQFTDTFPTGIQVYAVPNASTNCSGGLVSAVPGDGKVILSGATLAPNATCQVYVTTTSVKFLNLTNTIPALSVSSSEGYTNPLATSATLSTLQGLGVMKAFAPAYIGAGGTSRLQITLASTFDPNALTPMTLTGVSFTDNLPAGVTIAGTPNASTTCSDGGGGYATVSTAAAAVTLSGATMPAGSTCVIEVDVTAASIGAYDNTIAKDAVTSTQGVTNQNPTTARLNVVTQPTIAKGFAASSVRIGQATRLTVTISNGSGVALSGVVLSDTLPAGLAIAGTPNAGTTCSGGVVGANAGGGVLSLSGASINSGASCTFYADVVSNTAGVYANSIAIGALSDDQGLSNPGQASANLTVLPPAAVSKSFSPASIASGGTSQLTITLSNSSASPITLTSDLIDALPGNVLVAGTPNLGGTCAGTKSASAGGTTVTYASGGAIPAGSCTITVDVTSSVSGRYVNVIAAGQLQTSAGNNQDPAVATLGVDQSAPPTMGKAFNPDTIFTGGTSTLTISLHNANAGALTLTSPLVDTMPANVTIQGVPGSTCGGNPLTSDANSLTLPAGATIPGTTGCTITATVTSATAGSYTNTIAASDLVTDGGSPPLPASAGLVVQALTPPTVVKSFSPAVINIGGISTLTIALGNANAGNITLAADLVDTLPANVTVAAVPNVGGTCKTGNGGAGWGTITTGAASITYASGALIPPGGCTITVDVTSSVSGGPYTNTIAAGALQTDAGNNGAAATDELFVNPPQPPSISKSFSPTLIPKNGTSTLTISLGNGNAAPTTLSANLVDTLPSGVVVAAAPNVQTNCPGAVTAGAGSGSVTYPNGATLPAGGCSVNVDVTSATPGTYVNNINAGALSTGYGSNAVGASASLQVIDWPTNSDLSLTKAIAPGSGAAGDTQTVTLTWRNTNAASPTLRMYQCVISDPLPTAAFDETTAAEGTTPAGYTYGRSGNTVTYTRTDTTTPCETTVQTATFTVKLKAGVVTGSTYTNTATATAKTLPSNDPNVAAAATLTKNASANVTVTAPTTSAKSVASTSQNFTDPSDTNKNANPPVAIGETVTYSLPFNLPPGVTSNVILADEVTTGIGDVSLVSATLSRSSLNLSAAADPGTINGAAVNTPVDVTPAATTVGNEIRFALGDVTNADAASASYTLSVTLRVANVAANVAGHTITDQGRFRYQNASATPLSVTTAAKSVHVALPVVAVSKSAAPAAPAGGDTVTYTLTLTNTAGANSTAGYDWTFTDTLPATLENPGGFAVVSNPNGRAIGGSFTGNTLNGTIDQLNAGESVQVSYTASVVPGTPFGRTITNSVTARATTIPSGSPDEGGERSGSGGVNNLSATTSASVTTSKPTMAKTVVNAQPYYAVGDLARYRITVSVPVGTTSNFVINDTLPAGLTYVNGSAALTTSGGVTAPLVGPITPTTVSPLVFTIGSITATAAGDVMIEFDAQVANVRTNQNNTSLTNSASATYDNPAGGSFTISSVSAPAIKVGEPNLAMTKIIVSGATGSVAGSTVRWQFTVANNGTTTAYQQTITDQLPDHLNGISVVSVNASGGSIWSNVAGCAAGTAVNASSAAVSTTANANDTLTIGNICMPPGTTLTVQYDSTVMNSAVAAEVLNNTVRAAYASQPAGASGGAVVRDGADAGTDDDTDPGAGTCNGSTVKCNNYNEAASQALTIGAGIAIDKQADKTTATIGETVTYTIKVDVIEGVTPAVIVTDVLPSGLSYVSHSISLGHVGMTLGNAGYNTRQGTGQTVQFTLGDVGNDANGNAADDYVLVAITARVDNIVANQKGAILRNGEGSGGGQSTPTVTVQYGGGTTVGYDYSGGTPGYQGRPLTVTEPALKLTKTVAPAAQSLGDEVTFTLTVQHDGANSDATAFDIDLVDTLPAGMSYVANSASPNEPSVAGQVLTFPTLSSLTTAAGSTVITYRARIDPAAAVGTPLTNNAAVTWKSLTGSTGAATSGRSGPLNVGDTLNDYKATGSASVTPNAAAFIDAQKRVALSADSGTPGVADPGDTLRYTITLTNTGGITAGNVRFTDTIPANTTYAGNLTTSAGSASTVGGAPVTGIAVDVGSMNPAAVVTIAFDVTVNPGTPAGTVINNQGRVDSDQTVPKLTDADGNPANGDQPTATPVGGSGPGAIYATKYVALLTDADTSGTITAGDTMRYSLIVTNTGGSALANVVLTDPIPPGLSATGTPAASVGTIGAASGTVSWTIGALAAGQTVSASFDVSIDAFAGAAKSFSNQGSVGATALTPILTDGNGSPIDGAQPTVFEAVGSGSAAPALDVQKRWSLAVDADSNGVPSQGDSIAYTVIVTNTGSIAADDVRLSDAAPSCAPSAAPCTSLIAGSVGTSAGAVVAEGPPVQVNFGALAPGQTAIVTWRVTADAANGNVIMNQAGVSAANVTGSVLSDDDGVPGNGRNPTLTPLAGGGTGLAAPANLAKTLHATDQAGSSGANVLIGEVLTWRVSVDVPPGTTQALTLSDTLPADLALVAGSARLAATYSGALTSTANPAGINAAGSGNFVVLGGALTSVANGDGSTSLSLAFGNIINSSASAATYTLEFQSRVANAAANVDLRTRTNSASAGFLNALNQSVTLTPATSTVTVVEPAVAVTLSATPASLLPGGGAVAFTSTLTNSAPSAPAYDVTLSIPLPAGFTGASALAVSSPGNCAGGVTSSASGTPPTIDVGIATLPPGCVATITFDSAAGSGLTPASTLTASATARWTSLPGSNAQSGAVDGERTGSGSAPNTYVGQAGADITVNDMSLVKELVSSQTRYAIGDTVTYRLRLSVPGPFGPIAQVRLTDVLPAGLVYVDTASVTIPAQLSTSNQPSALSGDGTGGNPLTLDLGTVRNPTGGSLEVIVVYNARVANLLSNQDGVTWPNHGTLVFNDPGSGNPITPRDTADVNITVGEPNLAPTLLPVTSTTGLNAGSTVTYEYVASNNGSTVMRGLVLRNTLPAGLSNVQGLTVVGVNDVAPAGDATPAGSIVLSGTGTGIWTSSAFDLGIGDSVTIRYTVTLDNTVQPGQSIQNSVIGTYTSRPGTDANERTGSAGGPLQTDNTQLDNYRADAVSPALVVNDPISFDKAFVPRTTTQYAVGSPLTYRLTVGLPQGTVRNVVVVDTMPPGIDLVGAHPAAVGNGGITFGGSAAPGTAVVGGRTQITWTLGDVVNPANGSAQDDVLTFDIDARVANILANQAGVTRGNDAYVTFQDGAAQPVRRDFDADTNTPGIQPLDLTVVEPDLALTKSANVATMSLGDQVRFSLLLDHLAGSGGDAFDVTVVDTLPLGLQYAAGSGSITPAVQTLGDGRQQLTFTLGTLSKAADNTTITYRAAVQTSAAVGTPLTNNAVLTWSSVSGATGSAASGRTGADGLQGGGSLNDYRAQSNATVTPNTNAIYTTKAVALAVDGAGNGVVDAGDTLEYTVVLHNGANPATNVVFTDTVPANTTYVANSLTLDGAPVANAGSAAQLAVNVGALGANVSATIRFRVTVNAGVVAGAVISNQGVVDSDQTVPKPTDGDFNPGNGDQPTDIGVGPVAPPSLRAVKTVALSNDRLAPFGAITVGDQITYTIVLTNDGPVTLTEVAFADAVPAAVTVTGVSGNASWSSGQNVTAAPGTLAPGASVTITITGDVNAAGTFANQADTGSTQTGPGKSDDDGIPGNGIDPTLFTAVAPAAPAYPNLVISKSAKVVQQAYPDGLLHPNDVLQYDIVIANTGAGAATEVILNDSIPAGSSYVQAAASQGSVVATEPKLIVNVGGIAPGGVVTVTLQVRATAAIGASLTNAADLTCAQTTGCPALSNTVVTPIVGPNVFDPPSGFKTVTAAGPTLVWRMVWINSGNQVANNVMVTDPLRPELTYVPNTLTCQARGSSTVTQCSYDAANRKVVYQGSIAADFNKLTEATAANEVVITFQTYLSPAVTSTTNTATANWDRNGNGLILDDMQAGQVVASAAATHSGELVGIPALDSRMLVLLGLLVAFIGALGRPRGRGRG